MQVVSNRSLFLRFSAEAGNAVPGAEQLLAGDLLQEISSSGLCTLDAHQQHSLLWNFQFAISEV